LQSSVGALAFRPSRARAVTPIGIYARRRFSQLFINIIHPLSTRLLLFAPSSRACPRKPLLPSNKHPSYLLHSPPLMRLRGSECKEKTINHELRTRAKLSLSQRSLLVHHFKRASITTPLCLYCLRIPNPFTSHAALSPSPPVFSLQVVFLVGTLFSLGDCLIPSHFQSKYKPIRTFLFHPSILHFPNSSRWFKPYRQRCQKSYSRSSAEHTPFDDSHLLDHC